MRTFSLNGMLTSLATNYNRRNKDVKLYELGNIYIPKQLPMTELPEERMQFTLGFYGEGDFFTMKGVIEEFLEKCGLGKRPTYASETARPFLHPGRPKDGFSLIFLHEFFQQSPGTVLLPLSNCRECFQKDFLRVKQG